MTSRSALTLSAFSSRSFLCAASQFGCVSAPSTSAELATVSWVRPFVRATVQRTNRKIAAAEGAASQEASAPSAADLHAPSAPPRNVSGEDSPVIVSASTSPAAPPTTVIAAAGGAAGGSGASAPSAPATTTTTTAAPAASVSDELDRLRAENAKMKGALKLVRLKLDKPPAAAPAAAGTTSAVAGGGAVRSGSSSSLTASQHREIMDVIAGVIAAEEAKHTHSTTSAPAPAAPTPVNGAISVESVASAAASLAPTPPPAAAVAEGAAVAADSKADVKSDGKAQPVALFYGEDVYSSAAEAEAAAGVRLAYGESLRVSKEGGVRARDPRWASAVFASDSLEDDEEEVILLDLDDTTLAVAGVGGGADDDKGSNSEWWSVVDMPDGAGGFSAGAGKVEKCDPETDKIEPALHLEDARGMPVDGFQVVEDEDVVSAIAEFSAQCVRRFPGARQLDPTAMHALLRSSFRTAEPPSRFGKLWQWGSVAYAAYGYSSYAYYLYRQPAVLRGAYTVAKWILLLVV